tara:strand:- start:25688 stop:26668 length:981 start_codon:yes stop_codon:yes gene_type:complete
MSKRKKVINYWKNFSRSPRGQLIKKIVRRGVIASIIAVIIYQIIDIGVGEVIRNLPSQPLFYFLFFILYLSLPSVEVLIYRQIWPVRKWQLFKTFLTKRVYNDEVMGYSGEFYLFMWARKYLSESDKEILKNIRDNNILSAVSSNLVTVVLVSVLVFADIIKLEELIGNVDLFYIITLVVVVTALVALIIQFRKYLFDLPFKKACIIFSLYFSRFVIHNGLMMVLWAIVMPDIPLTTWFIFVAIMIIVNRIPFLPSRDLIFMLAGIELSRVLNMTTAAVAGMLLVYSALKKITNLFIFLLLSYSSEDEELKKIAKEKGSIPFTSDD